MFRKIIGIDRIDFLLINLVSTTLCLSKKKIHDWTFESVFLETTFFRLSQKQLNQLTWNFWWLFSTDIYLVFVIESFFRFLVFVFWARYERIFQSSSILSKIVIFWIVYDRDKIKVSVSISYSISLVHMIFDDNRYPVTFWLIFFFFFSYGTPFSTSKISNSFSTNYWNNILVSVHFWLDKIPIRSFQYSFPEKNLGNSPFSVHSLVQSEPKTHVTPSNMKLFS